MHEWGSGIDAVKKLRHPIEKIYVSKYTIYIYEES